MVICNCLIQAGQIPPETEAGLRISLDGFALRAFGMPAKINWIAVPEKSGFTAGKPTTSSVVSMRANAPLEQARREALLKELCDLSMRETSCSLEEVVGVIADPPTT